MTRADDPCVEGASTPTPPHPLRGRGVRAAHVQLRTGRSPEANYFGLSWPGQFSRSQQMRRAVRIQYIAHVHALGTYVASQPKRRRVALDASWEGSATSIVTIDPAA
jgi:hypothetical protein